MTKIHQDIWNKTRPSAIDLFKHVAIFCFTIISLWFMIQLTDILFPNMPLAVKIIAYFSELTLTVHFVKDSI